MNRSLDIKWPPLLERALNTDLETVLNVYDCVIEVFDCRRWQVVHCKSYFKVVLGYREVTVRTQIDF